MRQKNAGFTLVEMMVALVIGSIMTAMAVPSINTIRDTYRMRSVAQDVFMALQKARMGAVKENNQFLFSVAGATYTSHNDLNNNGVQDAGEPVTTNNLADAMPGINAWWWWFSPTPGPSAISFAPNGTAPSIGGIMIYDSTWTHWSYIEVRQAGAVRIY